MSTTVQGLSNRPALLLPLVALIVVFAITAAGASFLVASAVLAVGLLVATTAAFWRRIGPQRRAGQVHRSWPWHDR
jgi:hypothetical protein